MKCPFCGGKLEEEKVFTGKRERIFVCCDGENCPITDWGGCSKQIITELIRTRKALGMALDWLRDVATPEKCDDDLCREFTSRKLAEIKTALEQKDKR